MNILDASGNTTMGYTSRQTFQQTIKRNQQLKTNKERKETIGKTVPVLNKSFKNSNSFQKT